MNNKAIYYSRCVVGKGKWFWVTYLQEDCYQGNEPFAFGDATSEEAAEDQAMASARERYPNRAKAPGCTASSRRRPRRCLWSGKGISERFEERRYGDWRDFAHQRTIALDRAKLEREGRAWSRAVRDYFYTRPWEERRHRYVPECGMLLGLTFPWTRDQLKRAFRRMARKAHPDAGGSDEEFKAVDRAYEQALSMAVEG
jgi:hypothetical protein